MKTKTLTAALTAAFVGLTALTFADTTDTEHPAYRLRFNNAPAALQMIVNNERSKNPNASCTFGVTSVTGTDINKLLGYKEPANAKTEVANFTRSRQPQLEANAKSNFSQFEGLLHPIIIRINPVLDARFDYRTESVVTSIKDQGQWGTCWDFASCGALESSELVRNNEYAWAAEQQVLTCSGGGTVNGGWHMPVFDWFVSNGVTYGGADNCPYNPAQQNAGADRAKPSWYHAAGWGFIHSGGGVATTAEIKAALVAHGPVVTAVNASNWSNYTSGVMPGLPNANGFDHDVVIIGWDNAVKGADGKDYGCWIIKNSWGPWWGSSCGYGKELGYCYLPFDTSDVGYNAAWVDAQMGGH